MLFGPEGEIVAEVSEAIGVTTNNVAEYRALIAGLECARDLRVERVAVRLDSQLLVRQVLGEYRVRAPGLKPLFRRAVELIEGFDLTVSHVPREENTVADALANDALDR